MIRVQFIQKQEQAQKLSLTPAMRQSLECLQLSALDLFQYVQEAALENPMLEVELPSLSSVSLDSQAAHETSITEHETWDDCFARRNEPSAEQDALSTLSSADEDSLRDHLLAQLGQTALMNPSAAFSLTVWIAGDTWTARWKRWLTKRVSRYSYWSRLSLPYRCWIPPVSAHALCPNA